MSDFTITEPLVRKLLDTVDAGLVKGLGYPIPGQMCVEAAISYALGERHNDGPSCVEPAVRAGKIRLNDARWSDDQARAKGLRAVAIAQLGSKGVVDPVRYSTRLAELTIRQIVPIALRTIAKRVPKHAEELEVAALRCEREGSTEAARQARSAAYAAYAAYAADAATAATYATYAYAADAAYAAYAAAAYATATAAAYAAATAAAYAADAAAERDRILSLSASLMVQALRECGSPGCDWLWLVEETSEVKTDGE